MAKKFNIKNVDVAKLLLDERVKKILKEAKDKVTVKQIATNINERPSRLYYHIGKLESAGLIELIETKQIGNMVEKYYQAVEYDYYHLDKDMLRKNFDFVSDAFIEKITIGLEIIEREAKDGFNFPCDMSVFQDKMTGEEWMERYKKTLKEISGKDIEIKDNISIKEKEEEGDYVTIVMSYRREDAKKIGLIKDDD